MDNNHNSNNNHNNNNHHHNNQHNNNHNNNNKPKRFHVWTFDLIYYGAEVNERKKHELL